MKNEARDLQVTCGANPSKDCNRRQGEFPMWSPPYMRGEPLPPVSGQTCCAPRLPETPRDATRRQEAPRDAETRRHQTRGDAKRRHEPPQDTSRRLRDASLTPPRHDFGTNFRDFGAKFLDYRSGPFLSNISSMFRCKMQNTTKMKTWLSI